ncbi:MAG: sugar ABC transporter ATP-binding protein [Eubacteriales bacterium]
MTTADKGSESTANNTEHQKYNIELRNIYKAFGGVNALDDVSLRVKYGEIHALVGQNGAGKSTLVKILSGAYQKDKGEIYVDGNHFSVNSVIETHKAGLGIIYQEFALAPDLTVAENIFMNRMDLGNKMGYINWAQLYREAGEIITKIGFDIQPRTILGELSVAYQQIVEIAKALSEDVKVLVLDEPTAVLSPYETKRLFDLLRNLKANGVSIIYISHRLDEVFELSDRITVMRDGKVVDTVNTKETNIESIVQMMIGRSYTSLFPDRNIKMGETVLKVDNICSGMRVQNVSFVVHAGEIYGISGLVGAGKTELARAIFAADKRDSGTVELAGEKLNLCSPCDAVTAGIGYLPESRKEHGIILSASVRINTTMANLKKISTAWGLVRSVKEKNDVKKLIDALKVKTDGTEIDVGSLSGGNQQKISIGKWLFAGNKVILLDEPTRGVDIGAKIEIYNLINELTHTGLAIVLISSEIEEIIGLSDRVLVLNKGIPMAELNRDEITQQKIINYSVGIAG